MNHRFAPVLCGSMIAAILLGGIATAQQESDLTSVSSLRVPESFRSETRYRSLSETFRGIGSRLRRHEEEESAKERQEPPTALPSPQSEASYLQELAEWLSVPIPENATSGDISFAIKQALSETTRYSGAVLSDEAFDECRAAIPTTKDTEIFEAYHAFVKKVAGKKLVLVEE